MTGKGIVVKTSGDTATVIVSRSSACGHDCGECNLCKNPDIRVEILNPIGAKKGDTVKISADTPSVLKDAFLLYMLPIIGALVLYAVLSSFTISNIWCILGELVWFTIWYMFIRHYSKNKVTTSCALEILEKSNETNF